VRPTGPTRPSEEIARLGDEIYERDVRQLVVADHDGDFVAIDVESGKWAVAGELLAARERLRAQQPEAIDVWLLRVGYRAVGSLGGGAPRRTG
jgi:HD superfamily phosphodiesterase